MLNMRKLLSLTLLISFAASVSLAQDPNTELIKKLYTKIGESVGVGSNNPTTGETFLVLANPGILLDPNLNYNTPAGRNQFARTVDKVLNPSWIYGTRNDTVFSVYDKIINFHEAAQVTPTAGQIQQYKLACKVIFDDCHNPQPGNYSAAYERYQKTKYELIVISKKAEDYMTINQTQTLPPDLLADLARANDDFDLIGNKTEIEAAKATINTFNHIDPNSWWGELAGKFTQNSEMFNGNRFGKLDLYPSYSVWLDMTRSWSRMTLTQKQIEQTTKNSHTSVGGGGGFSFGFWSVGADYSNLEKRSFYEFTGSDYLIDMEITRVSIDRPWMDAGVFESRAWRWLAASPYDKKKISSGADAAHGISPPASDIMPFVPTGLLLARNVTLSAKWDKDLRTSFESRTSGGGSVGWGPWSFSGRYDSSNEETYRKATATGSSITFAAPQIIGFFVQVLPENPNPDRCYRFPSDTKPLPPDCSALSKLFNISSWSPTVTVNDTMVSDRAKELLRKAYQGKDDIERFKRLVIPPQP
jgi:hypothetical protein